MMSRASALKLEHKLPFAATALLVAAAALTGSRVDAQASPAAYTTAYRYDAMHRLVGTISPDPDGTTPATYAATRNTYDGAGRLIKVEKGNLSTWESEAVAPSSWPTTAFTALQTTLIAYDSQSRKIKETLLGGGNIQTVTQYSYDTQGNLQCTAVRMAPTGTLPASACDQSSLRPQSGPDQITENLYDGADQLIQVRKGVGVQGLDHAEATYSYTSSGKREYTIDADGNRAQFVYDGHDRLSQWIFPSKTAPASFDDSSQATALNTAGAVNAADFEQYGYDLQGNRTSLKKRDGQTIAYQYDGLNRMTEKDMPTADVSYSYDSQGHQLTAIFMTGGQGITNTYNGFGELASSTTTMGGTPQTLSYLYDADGNRVRLTFPDSNFFTYAYDQLDRETGILQGASTSLVTIAYDQLGRRATLARTGAGRTTYAYDNASRLQSLTDQLGTAAGGANDDALTFTYDPADQIRTKAVSNSAYVWTPASTSINRAYTTNGLNQYTAATGATYAYDANGNLTQSNSSFFCYDTENRLTGEGASATDCSSVAVLTYDPLGRLVTTEAGGTTTRLVYDGDDLVAEYNSAGTLLRRYLHGSGTDDPLVQYEGSTVGPTVVRLLYSDAQGSIIATTDNAGNLMLNGINRYDEYGIPQTDSSGHSLNSGRFQYTGQQWIPELGMYYYKARFYSPTLGRFMQTDPVGYKDQINLYAYVADDPVDRADPTGDEAACATMGGSCGEVGGPVTVGSMISDVLTFLGPLSPGFAFEAAEAAGVYGEAVRASTFAQKGANAVAEAARGAGLKQNVAGMVNKIVNVGKFNGRVKDFLGAAREAAGKATGFDHITEMKNSISSLRNAAGSLSRNLEKYGNSMGDAAKSAVTKAVDYANALAKRMEDTLK